MFRDVQDFLDHRTVEAEIDMDKYRRLMRVLVSITTKGEHFKTFGQKDLPQLTSQRPTHEDDIMLGISASPCHPEKGSTHIQLFSEGHPLYGPIGITAIVGTRDEERLIHLCILSTDGERAWANWLRGGDPVGQEAFSQLAGDFAEL